MTVKPTAWGHDDGADADDARADEAFDPVAHGALGHVSDAPRDLGRRSAAVLYEQRHDLPVDRVEAGWQLRPPWSGPIREAISIPRVGKCQGLTPLVGFGKPRIRTLPNPTIGGFQPPTPITSRAACFGRSTDAPGVSRRLRGARVRGRRRRRRAARSRRQPPRCAPHRRGDLVRAADDLDRVELAGRAAGVAADAQRLVDDVRRLLRSGGGVHGALLRRTACSRCRHRDRRRRR